MLLSNKAALRGDSHSVSRHLIPAVFQGGEEIMALSAQVDSAPVVLLAEF